MGDVQGKHNTHRHAHVCIHTQMKTSISMRYAQILRGELTFNHFPRFASLVATRERAVKTVRKGPCKFMIKVKMLHSIRTRDLETFSQNP